jgi:hypothetical protein
LLACWKSASCLGVSLGHRLDCRAISLRRNLFQANLERAHLHPERALRWILLLGAILTPVYMFAMLRPTAASGVIQVFPADRLEGTAGDSADEKKGVTSTLSLNDDWWNSLAVDGVSTGLNDSGHYQKIIWTLSLPYGCIAGSRHTLNLKVAEYTRWKGHFRHDWRRARLPTRFRIGSCRHCSAHRFAAASRLRAPDSAHSFLVLAVGHRHSGTIRNAIENCFASADR